MPRVPAFYLPLMHALAVKTWARFWQSDPSRLLWLLVGSHNLSQAAMGVAEGGGKNFFMRSWELSVMFLPSKLPHGCTKLVTTAHGGGCAPGLSPDGAALALPLPYALPPVKYGAYGAAATRASANTCVAPPRRASASLALG